MTDAFKLINDKRLLIAGGQLVMIGLQKIGNAYAFNLLKPDDVLQSSPALVDYLTEKKLIDNLIYVGMPHCPPKSSGSIHVDGKCAEAINFPVFNCTDSDYVWFDAEVTDKEFRQTYLGHAAQNGVAEYRLCNESTATESARVSCSKPLWFNTHIPHCGVNRSNVSRVIATLRFDKPLDVEML